MGLPEIQEYDDQSLGFEADESGSPDVPLFMKARAKAKAPQTPKPKQHLLNIDEPTSLPVALTSPSKHPHVLQTPSHANFETRPPPEFQSPEEDIGADELSHSLLISGSSDDRILGEALSESMHSLHGD
eukprot:TRINITY_DN9485_c0_g1_i1.p1 TRINITY_DN9485_c0_g1~~TRINITY_DN9485_c0_g1_i1.p1  ORF type:complete len:129 (+),score=27.61 TRINITY_DN9485_c0_g1_i1:3-389(+)